MEWWKREIGERWKEIEMKLENNGGKREMGDEREDATERQREREGGRQKAIDTHMHAHARTHTHTHARTHAHTHTHTHTHTRHPLTWPVSRVRGCRWHSWGAGSLPVRALCCGVSVIIANTHRTWGASLRGIQLTMAAAWSSSNWSQRNTHLHWLLPGSSKHGFSQLFGYIMILFN